MSAFPGDQNLSIGSPSVKAAQTLNPLRRGAEVTLFIALWMALGFGLHLGTETYLLIGVPLTALFQSIIRRQPLRAMWVRDAPPFRLSKIGWIVAFFLAALPVLLAVSDLTERHWVGAAFNAVIAAGAFPAVYCLWNLTPDKWRALALCAVISLGLDAALRAGLWLMGLGTLPHTLSGKSLLTLAVEIPLFVPTVCVIEEVAFRGLLDAHLHPGGQERGWLSATLLSALWGIWHLPVIDPPEREGLVTILILLIAHVPNGVALSLFWRRTGNLLVPGVSHAFLDAVRDAFFI